MKFLSLEGLSYFTTMMLEKISGMIYEVINNLGLKKVNNSTTNGNILIDDKETTVYTLPSATSDKLGGVKIGTNVSVSNGIISVANGSTSTKGVVQLTNSTASTSTTTAATPSSVKSAYDLANTAKTSADAAQDTADSKIGSISITSGTNNGTIKLTVDGTATDNIAVKGLGSAAYTNSSAYSASTHTHNYAGSSSAGGSANSAVKLDIAIAGSTTQPVYFTDGKPTPCTYTLGKSVPSDAKFTDTTYSNFVKSGSSAKAGLVPAPSTTAGTTKYLREDGTWAVPPGTTNTLIGLGITATAAELNVLDGITANVTELNYVDGVTSNIQTQLNEKANSSHTHNYLPLTGGTISGELKLSASNAVKVRHIDGSTDGYTGELYLNYSNPDADIYLGTNGRITNNGANYIGTASNADKLNGYYANNFCLSTFSQSTNMNEVTVSGVYRVNAGNTNAPSGADWGQLFVVHGGGDTIAQLMFDYTKGKCWVRTGNSSDVGGAGVWTEWRSFYTSENITYGASELTAGSSSLATGSIYLQYE